MKNIIWLVCFLVVSLCSCDKQQAGTLTGDTVCVTVCIDNGRTRAVGSYDAKEDAMNGIQLFCFDAGGTLEKYISPSGITGASVSLNLTKGVKHMYAAVNCPDLSSVTTEQELLDTRSRFDNNSLDGGFEMFGSVNVEVTGAEKVTIRPKRIVAKVVVMKIVADFEEPGFRSDDFVVTNIYLGNVAKSTDYGMSTVPSEYYVGGDVENSDAVNAMIYEGGLSVNLKDGGSSTVEHGFYVYPNSSANSTRLILKATLRGQTQTFSFALPDIERNTVYQIDQIRISKPSDSSLTPEINFNITVAPWEPAVQHFNYSY